MRVQLRTHKHEEPSFYMFSKRMLPDVHCPIVLKKISGHLSTPALRKVGNMRSPVLVAGASKLGVLGCALLSVEVLGAASPLETRIQHEPYMLLALSGIIMVILTDIAIQWWPGRPRLP